MAAEIQIVHLRGLDLVSERRRERVQRPMNEVPSPKRPFVFPICFYWSATTYAGSPDIAWGVTFLNGSVGSSYEGNSFYVRAVRTGP
jgi:hypothetical protein